MQSENSNKIAEDCVTYKRYPMRSFAIERSTRRSHVSHANKITIRMSDDMVDYFSMRAEKDGVRFTDSVRMALKKTMSEELNGVHAENEDEFASEEA